MLATAIVAFLFVVAILASLIAPTNPFDPASLNLMNGFTPPMTPNAFTGESFVMGTDDQGRDLLSAIIYGLRVSLFVGVMVAITRTGPSTFGRICRHMICPRLRPIRRAA